MLHAVPSRIHPKAPSLSRKAPAPSPGRIRVTMAISFFWERARSIMDIVEAQYGIEGSTRQPSGSGQRRNGYGQVEQGSFVFRGTIVHALSIYLFTYLSTYLFVYLSIYLRIYLSTYLSIHIEVQGLRRNTTGTYNAQTGIEQMTNVCAITPS